MVAVSVLSLGLSTCAIFLGSPFLAGLVRPAFVVALAELALLFQLFRADLVLHCRLQKRLLATPQSQQLSSAVGHSLVSPLAVCSCTLSVCNCRIVLRSMIAIAVAADAQTTKAMTADLRHLALLLLLIKSW